MTPAQCRAARGLLRWKQDDLASSASVSIVTVRNFELEKSNPQRANLDVMRRALEAAGVVFIPEDRQGPGVRLLRTAAFEAALSALVALHGSTEPLDRVEVIAAGFSAEDRDALAAVFGNRVWGETRREADARGCEIQDRLTRTGVFRT